MWQAARGAEAHQMLATYSYKLNWYYECIKTIANKLYTQNKNRKTDRQTDRQKEHSN